MKSLVLHGALLLAALAAGCSSSGDEAGAAPPAAGGTSGYPASGEGGASSSGGSISISADASAGGGGVSGSSPVIGNLSDNPPTYDWKTHTCIGCAATGGATGSGGYWVAGNGGETAIGGAIGEGGSASAAGGATSTAGSSGRGGSMAAGGAASSGGYRASGGSTGTSGRGGAEVVDAGPPPSDGPRSPDASSDVPGPRDAAAGSPDASASVDATKQPDTSPGCKAQIVPVVPTSLPTSGNQVVAGPNTQIVLRAEIVSGGPSAGATWTWQAWSGRTPLSPTALGQEDPATAAFVIADSGQYTFTATDSTQACSATLSPGPFGDPNDISVTSLQWFVMVNATPPPTTRIPVQLGGINLGAPSSGPIQTNIGLLPGVPVQISPSVGYSIVTSYVRISHFNKTSNELELVADGEEQAQTGQGPAGATFSTQLLSTNLGGDILKYNVLVVPLDGNSIDSSPGGTVAATAPQLFQNLTASNFNGTTFGLAGGVKVTGNATSATGPVKDVRVVLTSQNPTAQPPDPSIPLLFSSVGQSLDDGSYALNVQPGDYWVSVSPPGGSGLAQALAPDSVTINGTATIDFQWDTPSTADLNLNVVDADGTPVGGTHVRVTSSVSRKVGTLSVQNTGGALTPQDIFSNIQIEDTTSATGSVTFAKLPAGSTYDLLLVPPTLGPRATTTTVLAVAVPTGGNTQTVHLQAKATITGQLVAPQGDAGPIALNFSTVTVRAYDQSADSPEAPNSTLANADGSFSLGVTPGRSYVVLAMPPTDSGAARTFVGPGPMQASEFTVTQRLMPSIAWTGKVALAGTSAGIPGTALQIRCQGGPDAWPYCLDSTVPLAETTTDANGAFQFALANQTKR